MNDLRPNSKVKKLTAGNRKGNRKHEQQQFSASSWSTQPRQNIISGPPYTASNAQLARQHSRADPASTASRRTTTPAPTFSGPFVTRRSSKSGHSLRKIQDEIPSRTRSEVRSQYTYKFDIGASTLDASPPP